MSHPQSYEILLVPEFDESGRGAPAPGTAIRSAVVAATGDTGSSGYPRYAGDGIEADIDPATRTVEALLVDGAELDYSLSVRIAERVGGTTVDESDEADEADRGFIEEPAELAEEQAQRPEPADRSGTAERAEPAERAESAEETGEIPADRPGERT